MNYKWTASVLLTGLLILSLAGGVLAAETGVRAYAMGGAYTAISNDVSALVYNPAGIGQRAFDITISLGSTEPDGMAKLEEALNNPVDFAGKIDLSAMTGVGLGPLAAGLFADGLHMAEETSTEKVFDTQLSKRLSVGVGLPLVRVPLGLGSVRFGVAGQRIESEKSHFVVSKADGSTTATKWTGEGYALSAGAMLKITGLVTLGVSAHDLGGRVDWQGETTANEVTTQEASYTEKLEPVYRAGAAVKAPFLGVTLAVDGDTTGTMRYGVESNLLFNFLSIRAGQINGKGGDALTTLGVGLNLGPISVGAAAGSKDTFHSFDSVMAQASLRF